MTNKSKKVEYDDPISSKLLIPEYGDKLILKNPLEFVIMHETFSYDTDVKGLFDLGFIHYSKMESLLRPIFYSNNADPNEVNAYKNLTRMQWAVLDSVYERDFESHRLKDSKIPLDVLSKNRPTMVIPDGKSIVMEKVTSRKMLHEGSFVTFRVENFPFDKATRYSAYVKDLQNIEVEFCRRIV